MNKSQLSKICQYFELGTSTVQPSRVLGGLMNFMWCLETETGLYAIKQISKDIDVKNPLVRDYYELTETIAYRFAKQGIPAISALFQIHGMFIG